jgi:lysozyme
VLIDRDGLLTLSFQLTQNQFDALVSFSFNLGCGSLADLLPDLNSNNFAGATAQMKLYVHAGGATLPGLVTRRNAEVALFNTA